MAGKNTRDYLIGLIEDAPPAADPISMFETFVHRIKCVNNNVESNINGNHRNGIPARQTRDKLLERFRGL